MSPSEISVLIDESPMNRGASGMAWLKTPGNIAFSDEVGNVLLFEKRADHMFEFHWLTTVSKPRRIINFTKFAAREMYDLPGTALLYGLVPADRRDSNIMARWIGAQSLGQVSTDLGLCEMFILTREAAEGK